MKKDEYVCDCSDLDDIIAFTKDGKMKVVKVADKVFIGKDIIHAAVFKKNDEHTVYNMVYRDGKKGVAMMKRFPVTGVTRDKEYDLTKGTADSEVLYFTANPNGESEVIRVMLKPLAGLRKLEFDVNLADLAIKARGTIGNVVTKYPVKKVIQIARGEGVKRAVKIWYDDTVNRINKDSYGTYLGEFSGNDRILTVTKSGYLRLYTYDLINHFDTDIILIEKYEPKKVMSLVYYDGKDKAWFMKRFEIEETDKKTLIGGEAEGSYIDFATTVAKPLVVLVPSRKEMKEQKVAMADAVELRGIKAKGNKLPELRVKEVQLLNPAPLPVAQNNEGDANPKSGAAGEPQTRLNI